jgi:endonuclease/exonuclease/phosphatase family metal-dependent hydrolase
VKVAEIMRAEMATEHLGLVALCGDFNDDPEAASRAAMMKATTPGLVDVLDGRSKEERVTFINSEFHDSMDDVLLSPGLTGYFDAANATVMRGGVFETASDHRPVRVRLGK